MIWKFYAPDRGKQQCHGVLKGIPCYRVVIIVISPETGLMQLFIRPYLERVYSFRSIRYNLRHLKFASHTYKIFFLFFKFKSSLFVTLSTQLIFNSSL